MNWVPALITGGLAFVAAVAVAVFNNRALRKLADAKKAADQQLSRQQAEERGRLLKLERMLSDESAESNAKREYEYEALKRLYAVARPLLFQLGEACEVSNRRLDKLMLGVIKLHPGSSSLTTTTYRLAAPMVLVAALRRELTTIDLRLDPALRDQYVIARELLLVLQNGYELAACPPAVTGYRKDKRQPRQHLSVRQLDELLAGLSAGQPGNGVVKTFSQFERESGKARENGERPADAAFELFSRADPERSPVLWRALMTQRLLQVALLRLLVTDGFAASPEKIPEPAEPRYAAAHRAAMEAATAYLESRGITL